MVAGEDAEAARVDRQVHVDAELHAEVGDEHVVPRVRACPPTLGRGRCLLHRVQDRDEASESRPARSQRADGRGSAGRLTPDYSGMQTPVPSATLGAWPLPAPSSCRPRFRAPARARCWTGSRPPSPRRSRSPSRSSPPTARGATITDVDGNTFIDFAGGVGCLNVGHSHPARRRGGAGAARALQPHRLHGRALRDLRRPSPSACSPGRRSRARSRRRSSTPAPRRSRTPSSSRGPSRAGTP